MILRRSRPHAFERNGDRTAVHLGDEERSMLANLAGQFRSVMVVDDADPGLRRLHPTAYHDDSERDADYSGLVHDDLVRTRIAVADTVMSRAGTVSLDADQLAAWVQ